MTKPEHIDPLADKVLRALSSHPESAEIVLGGYLALQHHVDYRETHDIDAWWRTMASPETEAAILDVMSRAATEEGLEVRARRWGETMSFELCRGSRKRFAFQISERSMELERPVLSAWPPILIEALADTVGSKMNALVERGSPRDFLDIRTIVERGVLGIGECWDLWQEKNPGQPVEVARQKVLQHLALLESRRPLETILDQAERERARTTREWYKGDFLRV